MRVTVTGGAGFIGSHVVEALVAEGASVTVLDDLSSGSAENVDPSAELVVGSITDPEVAARAVADSEIVVHLAARRAVLPSVEQPMETDRVNVGGTLQVLDAARRTGVRRVISASSSSVYGGAGGMPTPETSPLVPRSPYAVSKLAGEHYARVFSDLYGLETVSLRFFNVYGPRQRPDTRYAAVIALFIGEISADRSPQVHGDGEQSRDFTYVADAAQAVVRAAAAPADACSGKAYNIAGGCRYSILDVLDLLEDEIGNHPARVHVDPRPGDVRHTEADVSAARRDLGHEPSVDLREGLRRTIDWFDGTGLR